MYWNESCWCRSTFIFLYEYLHSISNLKVKFSVLNQCMRTGIYIYVLLSMTLNNLNYFNCLPSGKLWGLDWPLGPQEVEALRPFYTVCTWRWQGCQLYASAAFSPLVLISVRGHAATGRITSKSMKYPSDPIRNRTSNFPNALPRAVI
jgi:hypothetical protein